MRIDCSEVVLSEDAELAEYSDKKKAVILVDASIKTYSVLQMCDENNSELWN